MFEEARFGLASFVEFCDGKQMEYVTTIEIANNDINEFCRKYMQTIKNERLSVI